MTLDATPVPRKIARLHLVSDILHNATSLPHAWVYRATFERRLTTVFDHLGDVYLSFPGRMKAEQFKIQVTNVRSGPCPIALRIVFDIECGCRSSTSGSVTGSYSSQP